VAKASIKVSDCHLSLAFSPKKTSPLESRLYLHQRRVVSCVYTFEKTLLSCDLILFPIEMRGDQLPVSATGPRFVLKLLFSDKSQNCQKFNKAREKIGTDLES
jgi:hypothetical protein